MQRLIDRNTDTTHTGTYKHTNMQNTCTQTGTNIIEAETHTETQRYSYIYVHINSKRTHKWTQKHTDKTDIHT